MIFLHTRQFFPKHGKPGSTNPTIGHSTRSLVTISANQLRTSKSRRAWICTSNLGESSNSWWTICSQKTWDSPTQRYPVKHTPWKLNVGDMDVTNCARMSFWMVFQAYMGAPSNCFLVVVLISLSLSLSLAFATLMFVPPLLFQDPFSLLRTIVLCFYIHHCVLLSKHHHSIIHSSNILELLTTGWEFYVTLRYSIHHQTQFHNLVLWKPSKHKTRPHLQQILHIPTAAPMIHLRI